MEKISGIYKITNNITGDFYIGSSKDIKGRWINHKSPSYWAKQPNSKLYQDMTKYGLNGFVFEVIEETDNLKKREQYWIDQLHPSYNRIRANGLDIERRRKACRKCSKKSYKSHREECLAKKKEYRKSHYEEIKTYQKSYCSRICSYEGEMLRLSALYQRFLKLGIQYPMQEAKKYLISN